jgi:hypothetical protein
VRASTGAALINKSAPLLLLLLLLSVLMGAIIALPALSGLASPLMLLAAVLEAMSWLLLPLPLPLPLLSVEAVSLVRAAWVSPSMLLLLLLATSASP